MAESMARPLSSRTTMLARSPPTYFSDWNRMRCKTVRSSSAEASSRLTLKRNSRVDLLSTSAIGVGYIYFNPDPDSSNFFNRYICLNFPALGTIDMVNSLSGIAMSILLLVYIWKPDLLEGSCKEKWLNTGCKAFTG